MSQHPKVLYRDGTAFEWDGRRFDILAVADEAEEKRAIADGWRTADDVVRAQPPGHPAISEEATVEAAKPAKPRRKRKPA